MPDPSSFDPPAPALEPLGRGVVVADGAEPPPAWASAPRVRVDARALADPEPAVRALDDAWRTRTPVVVDLAVDHRELRTPLSHDGPAWAYSPTFTEWRDRLHFLCWANTYDARSPDDVRWWWGERAVRAGAARCDPAQGDVALAGDGAPEPTPVWVDGGPRAPLDHRLTGAPVLHRDSVDLGHLVPQAPLGEAPEALVAALAPDQLEAVTHRGGGARILAPAGSGKTRVLTERLRLLHRWGWERDAVLAVAYNVRARRELVERTADLGPRVQTLNSLGLAVVRAARGDVTTIDEREVRRLVARLAPQQPRRANTDPLLPYLEALSRARLGLVDPARVEDERDDVPGFAELVAVYRRTLDERGQVDFDEQILGAVEALLADGAFRREAQRRWGRHLLVDEFQDLTPAHLLMLRLLAAPTLDVFAVGDDDQVIYGHAGADPSFLVDYASHVPGAVTHPLTVNYRCPAVVVRAARTLLEHNDRRVPKTIDPGPGASDARDALEVRPSGAQERLDELVSAVRSRLADGAAPGDIAVLGRVNAQLLAPHVALAVAGIPVASPVGPQLLDRTGARAALAYVRMAANGRTADTSDLLEVYRRPSRGLPRWFPDRLERRSTWSVAQLRSLAPSVGGRYEEKVEKLADDVAAVLSHDGTTASLLGMVRTRVGLGRAADLLDGNRAGGAGSHGDDLDALEQVAALHPDPAGFEDWIRAMLDATPADPDGDGVTIATVHRVKGQEWDHVVVTGLDEGLFPHRLAEDLEEERRVMHVALTRCRRSVLLLPDQDRPSRFVDELLGLAPKRRATTEPTAGRTRRGTGGSTGGRRARRGGRAIVPEVGTALSVLGGLSGTVEDVAADGITLATDRGGRLHVRWDEKVTADGVEGRLHPPERATDRPTDRERSAAEAALRAWRAERARADGVPAYVVLNDRHLVGIAERRPSDLEDLLDCEGIGPRRLDLYGEEIIDLLDSLG